MVTGVVSEDDANGSGSGEQEPEIDLSLFSKRCKPEPVEPCGKNSLY